ncbi:MAG TPA: EAL domain-containing protein [Accumulibacter sp.]|jgi:diguanylate cyclase (GGDEF)-like protein/PAS domain S-box-containing protein|nr:EAL domain-containing protein [Accumulibacter sp.]
MQGVLKINRDHPRWRPKNWMAWLVLLIGFSISALGWRISAERSFALAKSRFEARASEMRGAIQVRLQAYAQALQSVQGYVAATGHPTDGQWERLYRALDIERYFPGIVGIVYYRIFGHAQRAAVEAETRRFDPTFEIRPAGERDDYGVVTCAAPRGSPDARIVGSDSYASPVRREAMEAARDSGEIQITRKLNLAIDDPAKPRPAFLMFKALYRGAAQPATVEERRAQLLGIVNGGFRMDTLMKGVFGETPMDVALRIYDGENDLADDLYYNSHPDFDFARARHRHTLHVEIGGRVWRVDFASLPSFDAELGNFGYSWLILSSGVLASLLSFSLMYWLATTHARADAMAREMTASLRANEAKLRALFDQAPIGIAMFDRHCRVIDCNAKFAEYCRSTRVRMIGGKPADGIGHPDFDKMIKRAYDGELVEHEGSYGWADDDRGAPLYDYRFEPVTIDDGIAFVQAFLEDITERKRAAERIEHLAHHDLLTGLANRTLLRDRLQQTIAAASRHGMGFALLFLDLDFFKNINDTINHSAGDEVLVTMARRLSRCIRRSDTIARIGGDEFIILLNHLHNGQTSARVANLMLKRVAEPVEIDGRLFNITASIGIAVWPDDGADSEILSRNADVAMYHAKRNGRNNCQFFHPAMNARAIELAVMERDLRGALANEQLRLHYQPQVDGNSGAIVGAEALIRWQHPQLGLLGPGKFIEVAEECGLIEAVGNWVVHAACKQARVWCDAGYPLRVAVNVSPIQLRKGGLFDTVTAALADSGLAPCWLALEVTEGAVMENVENAVSLLRKLQSLGVDIEIDDFGTGRSSLTYLKILPLQRLKIDQSFVRNIPGDADGEAIVATIVNLAENLRLEVIAEGVETAAQRKALLTMGCVAMQGYHFSRPVPADELTVMLDRRARGESLSWDENV